MRRTTAVVLTWATVFVFMLIGHIGSAWIVSLHLTNEEAEALVDRLEEKRVPGEKWVLLLNMMTFWPSVAMVGWVWYKAAETSKAPPPFCKQCGWTPEEEESK